jgi:hypothetical protein
MAYRKYIIYLIAHGDCVEHHPIFLIFLITNAASGFPHGRMNYKDTEPYMSAFLFKIDQSKDDISSVKLNFYYFYYFIIIKNLKNCVGQYSYF